MGPLPPATEPSDCWQLVGPDDDSTPPSISTVLRRTQSRAAWRRAGLPVLFDDRGSARPVVRGGRVYEWIFAGSEAAQIPR